MFGDCSDGLLGTSARHASGAHPKPAPTQCASPVSARTKQSLWASGLSVGSMRAMASLGTSAMA
jgi:hypothetical protein